MAQTWCARVGCAGSRAKCLMNVRWRACKGSVVSVDSDGVFDVATVDVAMISINCRWMQELVPPLLGPLYQSTTAC